MKFLILVATVIFSANAQAADQCYKPARKAAVNFALTEGYISSAKGFTSEFDSEESMITENNGTGHKENHAFYNQSYGISVDVNYVNKKCVVISTTFFQNDQDQD